MILFLDFDGVLHPKGAGQKRFTNLTLFEATMREKILAHVQIVISSTWRTAYGLEKLRDFFAHDIGERIISTTSTLRSYATSFERGEECQARANKNSVAEWVALDDDLEGFSRTLRSRLVLCDGAIGFTEVDARHLASIITKSSGSS